MSPTVLRKDGFRFFFYAREADEPPHVHVEKEEGSAKVWLENLEMARAQGFNPNERRQILEIVREHRHQLRESWDEFFDQGPPRHQR